MKVGIVIVNYKTAALTIECLKSLISEYKKTDLKVIVVDNDSQDRSSDQIDNFIIQNDFQKWIELIRAEINGGFAYGNNLAIRKFLNSEDSPEYILLLNPDAFIYPNAVISLTQFLDKNPKVGVVGSQIEDSDGVVLESAFKFYSCLTELNRGFSLGVLSRLLRTWVGDHSIPEEDTKTDWVSGACMMIRSSVFQNVGLLDESYFMYYEETDFCLNASNAGWECWYVPESRVVHYVGQSSGVTNTKVAAKRRPQYWFESRRRYFMKNYGAFVTILADAGFLVGFATWQLRNLFQRKPHSFPPYFWWDTFRNSVFIKGFGIKPVKNKLKES